MTTAPVPIYKVKNLCKRSLEGIEKEVSILTAVMGTGTRVQKALCLDDLDALENHKNRVLSLGEMCDMVGDQHFGTVTLSDSDYLLLRPFNCMDRGGKVDS